ncbi:MAG: 50S ribosomal protein L19 [Chlamydiae bacterium]|nr:50S ribosomal protein L19 [Chlamydiota bacterium]
MSRDRLIEEIEQAQLRKDIPEFRVGDTVKVHTKIIEGNKERLQAITGTVIARRGVGLSETFALYRVAYGAAMERVFPLHSPRIAKIEVVKEGKVRRSKLYYIRGQFGKKAKIREQLVSRKKTLVVEDTPVETEISSEESTS